MHTAYSCSMPDRCSEHLFNRTKGQTKTFNMKQQEFAYFYDPNLPFPLSSLHFMPNSDFLAEKSKKYRE